MHEGVHAWVRRWAPLEPGVVWDVGGRDVNGTSRDHFPGAEAYVCIDPMPDEGVDWVVDFADVVPVGGGAWNHAKLVDAGGVTAAPQTIVCTEVFEHTPRWREIVANAAGWLPRYGRLIVSTVGDPFPPHSAIDEQPIRDWEYYGNVDPDELHSVMVEAGFVTIMEFYPDWGGIFVVGFRR